MVINEYIKSTNFFMPVYIKLFNIVFKPVKVPDLWLVGNIILVYKDKEDS